MRGKAACEDYLRLNENKDGIQTVCKELAGITSSM